MRALRLIFCLLFAGCGLLTPAPRLCGEDAECDGGICFDGECVPAPKQRDAGAQTDGGALDGGDAE